MPEERPESPELVFDGPLSEKLVQTAWKFRFEAYGELEALLQDAEPKSDIVNEYISSYAKFIGDPIETAREKALLALKAAIDKDADVSGQIDSILTAVVKRGLTSTRTPTKHALGDVLKALGAKGFNEQVITCLVGATNSRNLKQVQSSIGHLREQLDAAPSAVDVPAVLSTAQFKALLAHANGRVRAEAMVIARWAAGCVGVDAVKKALGTALGPSQLAMLEKKEGEKAEDDREERERETAPPTTRKAATPTARPKADTGAPVQPTGDVDYEIPPPAEEAMEENLDTSDTLALLASSNWSTRAMGITLAARALGQTKDLEASGAMKAVPLVADKHVNVAAAAARIAGLVALEGDAAKGVVAPAVPALVKLFQQRRPAIVETVTETLLAVVASVMTLGEMWGDIEAGLAHRMPDVRHRTATFIRMALETYPARCVDAAEPVAKVMAKLTSDRNEATRDEATQAICAILNVANGTARVNAVLGAIDDRKKDQVTAVIEKKAAETAPKAKKAKGVKKAKTPREKKADAPAATSTAAPGPAPATKEDKAKVAANPKQVSGLITDISASNWKVRKEAIDKLTALCEAGQLTRANLRTYMPLMAGRLSDSNINTMQATLKHISALAVHPDADRHAHTVLPAVVTCLASTRSTVRTQALAVISGWIEKVGPNTLQHIATGLKLDSHVARSTLISFLLAPKDSPVITRAPPAMLVQMLPSVMAQLTDSNVEVRRSGEELIRVVFPIVGRKPVLSAAASLKKAERIRVDPVIARISNIHSDSEPSAHKDAKPEPEQPKSARGSAPTATRGDMKAARLARPAKKDHAKSDAKPAKLPEAKSPKPLLDYESPDFSTSTPTLTVLPTRDPMPTPQLHQIRTMHVDPITEVETLIAALNVSSETEVIISSLKLLISRHRDTPKIFVGVADKLCHGYVTVMQQHVRTDRPLPLRLVRYGILLLASIFDDLRITNIVSRHALRTVFMEVLISMLDSDLKEVDGNSSLDGREILGLFNQTVLNVMNNVPKTTSFAVLFDLARMLAEALADPARSSRCVRSLQDPFVTHSKARSRAIWGDQTMLEKMLSLIGKCLLKLSRSITPEDIDTARLLRELHIFLVAVSAVTDNSDSDSTLIRVNYPARLAKTTITALLECHGKGIIAHLRELPCITDHPGLIRQSVHALLLKDGVELSADEIRVILGPAPRLMTVSELVGQHTDPWTMEALETLVRDLKEANYAAHNASAVLPDSLSAVKKAWVLRQLAVTPLRVEMPPNKALSMASRLLGESVKSMTADELPADLNLARQEAPVSSDHSAESKRNITGHQDIVVTPVDSTPPESFPKSQSSLSQVEESLESTATLSHVLPRKRIEELTLTTVSELKEPASLDSPDTDAGRRDGSHSDQMPKTTLLESSGKQHFRTASRPKLASTYMDRLSNIKQQLGAAGAKKSPPTSAAPVPAKPGSNDLDSLRSRLQRLGL
ncbi:HEAT repeat [Carpediemonas membranifera]|uniref:HEAT repeat n=1 Tax=Carpediemonas membranifera TaxID=201153 RepID=A0A8J6B6H0_9EUKA|nr:HEAT repeat [Carpediemonas membranifera]|eukprot:KAG9396678.1 HEAT repeat [Carpediemonas membranifera]